MKTIQQTQREQLAGRMKLTAVSFIWDGKQVQKFLYLLHNDKGVAIVPCSYIDSLAVAAKGKALQRGDTFTLG